MEVRQGRPRKNVVWDSLVDAMESQGQTEESLAIEIGVKPRTVRAYIYGEIFADVHRMASIARVLKTTEVKLREKGPYPPLETEVEKELVAA